MKPILFLFSLLVAQFITAQIDTLKVESNIKSVTVFFQGAEINRTANLKLTQGKHVIALEKLPQQLNDRSIQVEGTEDITILSVKRDIDRSLIHRKNDKIKNLESDLKKAQINIKTLRDKIDVLSIEEKILLENSNLSNKESNSGTEEIKQLVSYYRERLTEVKRLSLQNQLAIDSTLEEMKKFYEKINKVKALEKKVYSTLFVIVEVKKSVEKEIDFNYYIASAGWIPSYDFRVKEIDQPLKIVYNAKVFQSSGEDWEKVNVSLSTSNPALSGYKPELQKWTIGNYPSYSTDVEVTTIPMPNADGVGTLKGKVVEDENEEPVPFANVTVYKNNEQVLGTTTDFDGLYTLKPLEPGRYDVQVSYVGFQTKRISGLQINSAKTHVQNITLQKGIELQEVEVVSYKKPLIELDDMSSGYTMTREEINPVNVRGARSNSSTKYIDGLKTKSLIANEENQGVLSLKYDIKVPYTILSDGKDYNLKIKETKVSVDYEYFLIPRVNQDAYLTAYLDDWEELNLLSGQTNVYFQGTFTGESYINANQTEDSLTVSLGRDKSIFVSREQDKELDDKRYLGRDIKETVAWELIVKNNKNLAVKINLSDQYPISNRKSVDVDLLTAEEAEIDEQDGLLNWKFELAPQAKKEFKFSYEVKYPKYLNYRVR